MNAKKKKTRARRRSKKTDGIDPVDLQVGQRFRQARIMRGMTQAELGETIGVSFQAIQKYENGENRVSASRLLKAAQLLSRSVAFFFEDVEQGRAVIASETSGLSREEIDLVRHYRQIPDERLRDHILQMTKLIGNVEGAGAKTKRSSANAKSVPRHRKARSGGSNQ
jgi:transcriptional regulator with XRE-family HTH domain